MGGGFCVEISLGFDYDCGKEIFMEEIMLQHKLEKSASAQHREPRMVLNRLEEEQEVWIN